MVVVKYLPWMWTCASIICLCNGQESMVTVLNKLGQFEKDLLDNKMGVLLMEKRILNTIDVAKESLRAELKENIQDEVREAMAKILQGRSLQDMVKNQVVSELWHLKQDYHQLKRQLHSVTRSLSDFQEEANVFHESLLKKADMWHRQNTIDSCVRDKHRLEIELMNAASLNADINRCTTLKETCQSQMSKLITNVTVSPSTPAPLNVTSTSRTSVSTTTPRPEEVKSRILIAPMSGNPHQFRQLTIHSNSLSVYPYHTMKQVTTIVYVAKTNKLLIGLYRPDKIMSSTLDTRHVTILRDGVKAYAMAVDEDLDIVFMSTQTPPLSISRMSTEGKYITAIVNLFMYGSGPRQLSVDTQRKRIYGCNGGNLFTVSYDGQGLATLAAGSKVHALTLDQTAGVLYYNIGMKLMKMTVSNNVSTEVTTLTAIPYNMRLYRGTIYYGGYGSPIVGDVDVTNNTVAYTLQSLRMRGASTLCVCLVP